ncbi:MAG: rod shape-determining protein MreC [Phycisphaeraceae bacterium]
MKPPRLNQRRVLAGIVLLLLIACVLPTRGARAVSTVPRHLLELVVGPVSGLLTRLSFDIRPGHKPPPEARTLEDYANMRVLVESLQQRILQLEQENRNLRRIREVQEFDGFTFLPARVTMPVRDPSNPTLTIDRGQRHGVRQGQVVTAGDSLFGRVTDAGTVTSAVRLINAPDTRLVVRLVPPEPGAAAYDKLVQVQQADNGKAFWAKVEADTTIRVGDLAHLADDAWPTEARGFIVGRVQRIIDHPDWPGLARRVIIKPLRPLGRTSNVIVLVPVGAAS